jgi:hypothetical protein
MLFAVSFPGFDLDQPVAGRDCRKKSPPGGGLFCLFQEITERTARALVLLGDCGGRWRTLRTRQKQDDHCADERDRSQSEERGFMHLIWVPVGREY